MPWLPFTGERTHTAIVALPLRAGGVGWRLSSCSCSEGGQRGCACGLCRGEGFSADMEPLGGR